MKAGTRLVLIFSCFVFSLHSLAQVNSLELSPEIEKMYNPFMIGRHSGIDGLADFKKNHPHEYLKELWYYSQSFYIKRDYVKDGIELNEAGIDITRFETSRKETVEAVILMAGFKDALILLPANKLIYKP